MPLTVGFVSFHYFLMLMPMQAKTDEAPVAEVLNRSAKSGVLFVCEHASNYIPTAFNDLGLPADLLDSHITWDPGALGVAEHCSRLLSARLVVSKVSRLLYDCNRTPDAPDAIPERSEIHDIPGNQRLSANARGARVRDYYRPFEALLSETLRARPDVEQLVTIHSFTPIYGGRRRDVEIGVLHETDRRLADAMLLLASEHTRCAVRRNAPYGPEDGVTHTLRQHGNKRGIPNVMLEIRNDLIVSTDQQERMAEMLCRWLSASIEAISKGGNQ